MAANDRCITDAVREDAEILWHYHNIHDDLTRADAGIVLGSHDMRVADTAADLYLRGVVPVLVLSGGKGKITHSLWDETEAAKFARRAEELGVPRDSLLIDEGATNTGENVEHARRLLTEAGRSVKKGLLVAKPYMKRRALRTAQKVWPEVRWSVAGPPIPYTEYTHVDDAPEERMINLMVGDTQRIWLFAASGFQAPDDVPEVVRQAYERLVAAGFTDYVLPEP
jgi:uncharacterized SAM-binding protein YcdF (DUF218 family)